MWESSSSSSQAADNAKQKKVWCLKRSKVNSRGRRRDAKLFNIGQSQWPEPVPDQHEHQTVLGELEKSFSLTRITTLLFALHFRKKIGEVDKERR